MIRQAFDLSWKYKWLWIFGFFASFLGGWSQIFKPEYRQKTADFLGNHPILIIVIAVYTFILLLFFIAMHLIAGAGLIDGVTKIIGGGSTRMKELFRSGFRHIRNFAGLWIMMIATSLVIALTFIAIAVVPFIIAGTWGLLVLPIAIPLAVAVIFMIISLYSLAQREIVIEGRNIFDAIVGSYKLLITYPGQCLIIFLISAFLVMLLFLLNSALFALFSIPLLFIFSYSELVLALVLFVTVPVFIVSAIAISGFFGTVLNSIYTIFYLELKRLPAAKSR
jgi:hypothetical protein